MLFMGASSSSKRITRHTVRKRWIGIFVGQLHFFRFIFWSCRDGTLLQGFLICNHDIHCNADWHKSQEKGTVQVDSVPTNLYGFSCWIWKKHKSYCTLHEAMFVQIILWYAALNSLHSSSFQWVSLQFRKRNKVSNFEAGCFTLSEARIRDTDESYSDQSSVIVQLSFQCDHRQTDAVTKSWPTCLEVWFCNQPVPLQILTLDLRQTGVIF